MDFLPQRVSNALMVTHSNVPFLDGLRKDHKAYNNEILGPPLRPLSNAKIGPNAPLANLLARILRTVRFGMSSNGYNTEILSTEELLYYISKFNDESRVHRVHHARPNRPPPLQSGPLVIGSMDVSALYPQCKIAQTVKMVEKGCNRLQIGLCCGRQGLTSQVCLCTPQGPRT